jgi:cell division protein ZapA (FtsZ GTPase activity inhibitor)
MQDDNSIETLTITVWLSGRSYRIRINPNEESAVRKAIKLADQKLIELRTHYPDKGEQDFLAMCLLSYAADAAIDTFNNPLLQDELNKLSLRIDRTLSASEDQPE